MVLNFYNFFANIQLSCVVYLIKMDEKLDDFFLKSSIKGKLAIYKS